MCKLVSFGRNLFRINANYDKETRYYCCCFGGCYSTGAESGEWRLFCKKFEDSMEAVVERIGGCCSTGAVSKTRQLFSFGRNSFSNNAKYDKQSRYYCCCFGGCCSTGTDSEALRLFWKKLEDVPILQLSRKHRSFSVIGGSCCSTG
uniref:Uncharacterized protein n=1 Tax=Strongyloides stercoralis TaxID=6248 RepID=A0AAF5DHL3_STRER